MKTIITLFLIIIPLITILLLLINLILAPHKPYKEKDSPFECGFHSFVGQNRTQFNISFFIFGILFLVFDIEIALIYPMLPAIYNNELFGLIIVIIFFLLLTLGFAFELGKKALTMLNRQNNIKCYKYKYMPLYSKIYLPNFIISFFYKK